MRAHDLVLRRTEAKIIQSDSERECSASWGVGGGMGSLIFVCTRLSRGLGLKVAPLAGQPSVVTGAGV